MKIIYQDDIKKIACPKSYKELVEASGMAMKMLGGTSKFYYMDEDQKDIVSIQRESDYVEALQSVEANTQLRVAIAQTQKEARTMLQPPSAPSTQRVSSGTGQLCGV